MEKMKVCHIVNWYPNEANNKEAIWTKKHIDALNRKCENDVFSRSSKLWKVQV